MRIDINNVRTNPDWESDLRIGKNTYQLWAVDTNILSEMLKDPNGLLAAVLRRSLATSAVLCVAPWALLEIRDRPQLYDAFIRHFACIPFVLLKSAADLFDEEVRHYPDQFAINPVLAAFSPDRIDEYGDVRGFFQRFFNWPEILALEEEWRESWKDESLESMLALRKNFAPSGERYTGADADRFVEEGVFQHVLWRRSEWAASILEAEGDLRTEAFPSLRMAFYSVFFRFYADSRSPERQDVFDIVMAPVTPYVSMVLTEAYQAEIVRKAMRRDPALGGAIAVTLREVRKW